MQPLTNAAREGRLVPFLGAGVSVLAPTSLPSWKEVNERVAAAIAGHLEPLIGVETATEVIKRVDRRRTAARFPPEYQAHILAECVGESYFRVLQCLDSREPNTVHDALARLAAQGCVPAIVTTNFDRAIEAAFARAGVELRVCVHRPEVAAFAAELEGADHWAGPCTLLKLHGSADDPKTLIDTLAQRKRGLPVEVVGCAQALLRRTHWLFLGWSGGDLEADELYLGLKAAARKARGFTWLVQRGRRVSRAVTALCTAYGGKAQLVEGSLPEWLPEALDRLVQCEPGPAPAVVDALKASAEQRVTVHASAWAADLGEVRCAIGLSSILVATGESVLARQVLESVRARRGLSNGDERHLRGDVDLAEKIASLLRAQGDDRSALALYEYVAETFRTLGEAALAIKAEANAALIHQQRGDLERAKRAFEAASLLPPGVTTDAERSVALHNLAIVCRERGEFAEAERLLHHELDILRHEGDEPASAIALNNLGEMYGCIGRLDEARAVLRAAGRIRRRLGDNGGRANVLGNLAKVFERDNRLERAQRIYIRIASAHRAWGDERSALLDLANIANIDVQRGRSATVLPALANGVTVADSRGWTGELVKLLLQQGRALRMTHAVEESRRTLERAATLLERVELPALRVDVSFELGHLCVGRDDLHAAYRAYRQAERHARGMSDDRLRAYSLTYIGIVAHRMRHPRRALVFLVRGNVLHERHGSRQMLARGSSELGEVLLGLGRHADAARRFEEAERAMVETGAPPREIARVRTRLIQCCGVRGRVDEALARFDLMERELPDGDARAQLIMALRHLAAIAARSDDSAGSERYLAACERLERQAGLFSHDSRDSSAFRHQIWPQPSIGTHPRRRRG